MVRSVSLTEGQLFAGLVFIDFSSGSPLLASDNLRGAT